MGGANSTENNLDESVKYNFEQNINKNISSTINNSSSTSCQNIQSISDSVLDGCTINFGEQICTAMLTSNYTGNNIFDEETEQETYTDTQQTSTIDGGDGFGFGNKATSTVSITSEATTKMIQDISMHMLTDCSRNLSAVNEQTMSNTTCTGASQINFAAQTNTSKVIGDCAAAQSSSSKSSQYITALSSQSASVTGTTGLSSLIIMCLMIPLLCFLIPYALRMGFSLGGGGTPLTAKLATLLLFLLVLACAIWWPGYFSLKMGIFPWGYPYDETKIGTDGDVACNKGVLGTNATIVNRYMWWDNNCNVASYRDATTSCTDADKTISYTSCGIFATVDGCDDTDFLSEKTAYINAAKACSKIDSQFVTYCRPADFAAKVFNDPAISGIDDPYPGCSSCVGATGTVNLGYWINSDKTCSTANVDHLAYASVGKVTNSNFEVVTATCPDGDSNCYATMDDLLEVSPDDCQNEGYQMSKAKLSKFLSICADINTNIPTKANDLNATSTSTKLYTLAEQCDFNPSDFLRCNDDTAECSYLPASGCTYIGTGTESDSSPLSDYDCSSANQAVLRSCRNDYSECTDENYLTDKATEDTMASECASQYESWQKWYMRAFYITMGTYGGVVLLVIVLFFLAMRAKKATGISGAISKLI